MDTHTAVAAHVCSERQERCAGTKKCVIASTASPYKFVKSVMGALGMDDGQTEELEFLPKLESVSGVPMPQAVKDILRAEVLHKTECDVEQMEETVKTILRMVL